MRLIRSLRPIPLDRLGRHARTIAAALVFIQPSASWGSTDAASTVHGDNSSATNAAQENHGPSFDCTKASTHVEKMICADERASDLDGQLARAYRAALVNAENADSLKAEQRGWLTGQRNKCGDVTCLRQTYEKRLVVLSALGARNAGVPQRSPPAAAPPAERMKPGTPAVRKVKFPGGEVTITPKDEFERVTVQGAQGEYSESLCQAGDFDAYSAFFGKLKSAVVQNDRSAVATLMAFPLRVNIAKQKPKTFRSEAAFLKAYDEVFTEDLREGIRGAEPADIFCRDGSTMFCGGAVWADYSHSAPDGAPKVAVINR
jgi:uncharacterized protein